MALCLAEPRRRTILPAMKAPLRILCALPALVLLCACWTYISPEASQRFQSRQGRFTVTVYPVHVV